MRRSHLVGLAGLAIFGGGVGLYLRGSADRPSLVYWLGGPFLCFLGAGLFMGAILWPIFYRSAENDATATSKPRREAE